MSTRLTSEQQEALDEAFAALQPSYDAGDDGDAVRLALNAIAGILGERSGLEVGDDDALVDVLAAMDADEELQAAVAALYETATEGAYGEGLTEKGAEKVNGLVSDIEEPIVALIKKRPSRARAGSKVTPRTRRTKK